MISRFSNDVPCMNEPISGPDEVLRRDVEASWHRFLDVYEPLRPETEIHFLPQIGGG